MIVTSPLPNEVYQRNLQNVANVPVVCTVNTGVVLCYIKFTSLINGQSTEVLKMPVDANKIEGTVLLKAGWYRVDFMINSPINIVKSYNMGVGEMFILFGHSVVQGADLQDNSGKIGATDERVISNSYAPPVFTEAQTLDFKPIRDNSAIGPFHGIPYAWGLFAQKMVALLNVPVLLIGAGFGGSNINQNYMAVTGQPYSPPFNSPVGMPFTPLRVSIAYFAKKLGCRAIITQHGINDAGIAAADFYAQFKTVIEHTQGLPNSKNIGFILIKDDTGNAGFAGHRAKIVDLWQLPNVYQGPDFADFTATTTARQDRFHLANANDKELYANLWANKLTGQMLSTIAPVTPNIVLKPFLAEAKPKQPELVANTGSDLQIFVVILRVLLVVVSLLTGLWLAATTIKFFKIKGA